MQRRSLIVAGLSAALAGCLGGGGDEDPSDGGDPGPQVNGLELDSDFPIEVYDDDQEILNLQYHPPDGTHWHREPLELVVNEPREVTFRVYDANVETVELGAAYRIEFDPPSDADAEGIDVSINGERVTFTANESGDFQLRFAVVGDAGNKWVTPPLEATATSD